MSEQSRKMNLEQTLNSLRPWFWPIESASGDWIHPLITKKYGHNGNLDKGEVFIFFDKLRNCLSLDLEEKRSVLLLFETLSKFQLDELLKTFDSDYENIFSLNNEENASSIRQLIFAREFEWGILLNNESGFFRFFEFYMLGRKILEDGDQTDRSFQRVNAYLIENNLFNEILLFNEYIFDNESLSKDLLYECINICILALIQIGITKTTEDIKNHRIFSKVNEIEGDSEKSFIRLLSIVYIVEKYGISSIRKADIREFVSDYKSSKKPHDISSFIGFYYLCKGDVRHAHNAFLRSSKIYDEENTLVLKRISKLFHRRSFKNADFQKRNMLRNIYRLSLSFSIYDKEIPAKKIIKGFKKIAKSMDDWRITEISQNFSEYIYFVAIFGGEKRLKRVEENKLVNSYILDEAPYHDKYLFNLAVGNYSRESSLRDFRQALLTLNTKIDVLFNFLAINQLLMKNLGKSEADLVSEKLKIAYKNLLEKKYMIYDNELDCLNNRITLKYNSYISTVIDDGA